MAKNNEMTQEQKDRELEAALTDAENKITDAGYSGFCSDKWYCVEHALTHIWKGDLEMVESVVRFCTTGTGDLRDPDNFQVDAWHDDRVQYLQSSSDYAAGIHCSIESCRAEIYPAADNDGEEKPETWGLLVSNVGWVRKDHADYEEVKRLFAEYAASKRYEQVTMWSSDSDDPIEEAYTEDGL